MERLPNGVILAIATVYAADKVLDSLSNANPAVGHTTTAHGISTGDFFELTSGWSKANGGVFRATAAAASDLSVEGLNTTDTGLYPAGTGIGKVRKISTFTQIPQVLSVSTSGGEMQFATFSYLENDFESQLPTQSSPISFTIEIGDDPTLPGYQALVAAAKSRALTALKMTLPGGSLLLYNGYISVNETPKMNKNEIMSVTATFSLKGPPVRYAS